MDATQAPSQQTTPAPILPAGTPAGSSAVAGQAPHTSWTQGPLPEILGYVGAALVASAALTFVAQSWEAWGYPIRLGLVAGAAVVLYAVAIWVTVASGGRSGLADAEHGNRRRLVALLVSLAAITVGGLVALIIDWQQLWIDAARDPWIIPPAVAAFAGAAVAVWLVGNVLTTLAMAATSAWSGIVLGSFAVGDGPTWWMPILIAVSGAIWLAIAPRVLAVPVLSEALGMAWILVFLGPLAMTDLRAGDSVEGMPDDMRIATWIARGALIALAVVALIVFARGGSWAWGVGGIISATFAALGIAGQAMGWVAGLLAAGVVLLAVSGLLLLMRRRTRAPDVTSDPGR